ncbi:MAG: hypothetical protein A2X86_19385 [Bdellovibrionales bacterium GWA2_49_15]|nr:MAG: hypothetical protein A2X86_19385 [Bdellovibrionales bacterium GWA2_49_15]HAZ14393.1 hypothetical protein [Bdellovibrionales bacterium]
MQYFARLVAFTCLSLFLQNTWASFPEFFGASPSTSAIGSQANTDFSDPANAYYAGALMAFSDKLALNVSYDYVDHDFYPINNIVVKNSTNFSGATQNGNALTEYGEFRHSSLHAVLPIRYPGAGNLVLNLFSPVGNFLETNTGHPTLPEYVFYHARYKRTEAFLQYAHPFTSNVALALGAYVGFQVRADVNTQASINGTTYGSSAAAKAKVAPSLAGLLSLAYKLENWAGYLAYKQEMKSNLDANVIGDAPLGGTSSLAFDIGIATLPYYDPASVRLGVQRKGDRLSIMGLVEYQMWGNYQTPVVQITQRASVLSSDNYEKVQTQNIFVPKLGVQWNLSDSLSLLTGVAHRPTPLKGDFSGAGNSVDTDSTILCGGLKWTAKLMGMPMDLGGSIQWHQLEDRTVVKSAGQENGSGGSKIGAPGYKIGGDVYMASAGLKIAF